MKNVYYNLLIMYLFTVYINKHSRFRVPTRFHDLYCENKSIIRGRNVKLSEMNILAFVL